MDADENSLLNLDPRMLAAVLAAADDAIVITRAEPFGPDPHPEIVYINQGYVRMTGYRPEEVLGRSPRIVQGPGTDRATLDRIREKLEAWQPVREEVLNYRKDGTPFWVELNIRPLADANGWFTHWVSVQRDVTVRREAMEALARHARDLEDSHRLAKLGIWRWVVDTDTLNWSPEVYTMFGLAPEASDMSFARALGIVAPADRGAVLDALDRCALIGRNVSFEFQTIGADGAIREVWAEGRPERDAGGRIVSIRGLCQDVTERKQTERTLMWSATHDALTGLLNMEGLKSRATTIFAKAQATGRGIAVGLVDLDHLKLVNDNLGHSVGDALIIEASHRLAALLGTDAACARLGGDEFVFVTLMEDIARLNEQLTLLIDRLKEPFTHQGRDLDCCASIGIAISQHGRDDLSDLVRNADLAMYRSKETGRGGYAFFSLDLQEGMSQRLEQLQLARLALGGGLIVPFYQPKYCLRSRRVVGYEALLRIRIGDKVLPPSAIEHAFEHVEFATRLGDEMLRRVLEQIRRWRAEGFDPGTVAVNVSAAEIARHGYADRVINALARAEVPASTLQIEVTEGVVLGRGADRVAETLQTLRRCGVSVALDDFGTGYASLTHLKSLPISAIKIDKSFVQDIATDPSDAAIVESLVRLARALNLEVVAEGIETSAQANTLLGCGCYIAQGYLFGKALPADQCRLPQASRRSRLARGR